MNKFLTEKRLILINFIIVAYFVSIYLINLYQIDFVLVGVFRELLTLPFLAAQIVFLFIGIKFLVQQQKRRLLMLLSVIALAVSTFITIGSFF